MSQIPDEFSPDSPVGSGASGEDISFVISFPSFFIAKKVFEHRVTGELRSEGVLMFGSHYDPSSKGVVVFTDGDAAVQYRDEQFSDFKVVPLRTRQDMLEFLRIAECRQVGWVAFDPYRPDRRVTMIRMDLVLSWFTSPPSG